MGAPHAARAGEVGGGRSDVVASCADVDSHVDTLYGWAWPSPYMGVVWGEVEQHGVTETLSYTISFTNRSTGTRKTGF